MILIVGKNESVQREGENWNVLCMSTNSLELMQLLYTTNMTNKNKKNCKTYFLTYK